MRILGVNILLLWHSYNTVKNILTYFYWSIDYHHIVHPKFNSTKYPDPFISTPSHIASRDLGNESRQNNLFYFSVVSIQHIYLTLPSHPYNIVLWSVLKHALFTVPWFHKYNYIKLMFSVTDINMNNVPKHMYFPNRSSHTRKSDMVTSWTETWIYVTSLECHTRFYPLVA